MFILEKPYVSELLVDTIVQNDWPVLDNETVEDAGIEEGAFALLSENKAIGYYSLQEFPLIYSNSEKAIIWIMNNLPKSNLTSYIKLFKDKIAFRKLLKEIYPDFYFEAKDYSELKSLKPEGIKYPIVLKPSVGFLSLGVHIVNNVDEWFEALDNLNSEMQVAKTLYPNDVVDSSKFIIEELIEGQEYAIDAYFNRNGETVILNIFEHPFLDGKDVKDRIYITSAEVMIKYMAKFHQLIHKIGEMKNIRNFPIHIEVRVRPDGSIIPIEVNPMRFAGWCTTDIAKYAWGINVYEYFYNQQKPDWNRILENAGKKIYYFSMADVPANVKMESIKSFDYPKFLANYSNIIELRRINPKENPLFAIIFGSTDSTDEINKILALKTSDYVVV